MANTKYAFSNNGINDFLHDYYCQAWKIAGNEHIARGVCGALIQYISTGRSSIDFEKSMLKTDPGDLAKVSLIGGSDEQILRRIKQYVSRR